MTNPTPADVRVIISTDLTDLALESIIEDAALLVEPCIASFSDSRKKAVVKWVTAHLIASMPSTASPTRTLTSFKLGDAQEGYSVATLGDGLKGTLYGQQALALDANGCLANLGKRKVSFTVL